MAEVKSMPSKGSRLRVLWVTTKAPWPPEDGGKLLMAKTLCALDPEQVEVVLAGPWSLPEDQKNDLLAACPALQNILPAPKRVRSGWRTVTALAASSLGLGAPFTARQHRNTKASQFLHALLREQQIEVIHAEQPHALGLLPKTSTPLLLRCQNVESDLWTGLSKASSWPRSTWLRSQARAVRRWELAGIDHAHGTAAISLEDQQRFIDLGADSSRLFCLAPAFPEHLQCATAPLSGAPSLLLFAGSSWRPNQLGVPSFLESCWPLVRRSHPKARLHIFGASPTGPASTNCHRHSFPERSRDLFAPGSILLVPAQVTSGIRMKILEAWARGVPVITTRAGAKGLGPKALQAVALADRPHEWSERLHHLSVPQNVALHVNLGRQALRQEHNPEAIAQRLVLAYQALRDESPPCLTG